MNRREMGTKARTRLHLIALAIAAMFIFGCSTVQHVPLPDQNVRIENVGMSRIYVVDTRSSDSWGSITMKDDEVTIGSTGGRGYLCWERPPGTTTVSANGFMKVTFYAASNSVHYLGKCVGDLVHIDEALGQQWLKQCHPPTIVVRDERK